MGQEKDLWIRGLEHLSHENRLGEVGLFRAGEETDVGRPYNNFQYLKGA